MQCLDEWVASASMDRSSCCFRHFLSRSHRTLQGEMMLCLNTAQPPDAQGLWLQSMSGVMSGYCITGKEGKLWLSISELIWKEEKA
jgi:hypothetical protein